MELLTVLVSLDLLATVALIVIVLTEGDRRKFAPHAELSAESVASGYVTDVVECDVCHQFNRSWTKELDGVVRCPDCYHKNLKATRG